jgi:hypothetical protein
MVKEIISLDPANLKTWQDCNLEHLRYDYHLNPGERILDIGSYQREWSNTMIEKFGCVAECFDALDNKAAWIQDGEIEFGGAYYYTSVFDTSRPMTKYKCVDIAHYLNTEIAVCKINIEGMEYELLDYMDVRNIANIQVQFHRIENVDTDSLYQAIANKLSLTHRCKWRYPFVWENWERL